MLRKPKRFDPYFYANTDPEWFEDYCEQELDRIANGERKRPELMDRNAHGHAIFMEHDEYYQISYEDQIASIEMPIPTPRDVAPKGYHKFEIADLDWQPHRWALIDPYEALITNTRWGAAARYIIWCLWVSKHEQISFPADKGLGDCFHEFLMKKRLPYFAEYEDSDPDVRAKTLRQAAMRLADQGFIQIFKDIDAENWWLVQGTEQLTLTMPELISLHPEEFKSLTSENDAEEIEGLVVDLGKPTKMWRAGSAHWNARDGAHFYAPVEAQGENPRQPIEAVVRGTPTSTSQITPTFASFQQVSEIVTELALQPYMEDVSNQKIFQAMAEIREAPRATTFEDVEKCLRVFLPPDLINIMDYVESKLDPKGQDFIEHSTKISGVHGIGRVELAIGELPTKDGTQRHVLRQIRLLTIALIQDLLGTFGGQFVDYSTDITERSKS